MKTRDAIMAEDVIDIRKRIEEIRNEVSSAIQSEAGSVIESRPIASQPAGEVAEFSVAGVTSTAASRKSAQQLDPDAETLTEAKGALDTAAKMPSFQLNVRNQGMHKGLLTLIIFQLLTNIALIATLWYKLG